MEQVDPKPHGRARVKAAVSREVHRVDFGLRLIIVMKTIKGSLLVLAATGTFLLIGRDLEAIALRIVEAIHLNPASPHVNGVLERLTGVRASRLAELGAAELVYATLMYAEAWGLHRRRIWAEWLTIVATSLFIPLELYELFHKPSLGKALVLTINVAVVTYVGRHRFLFGPGPVGRWLHHRLGWGPPPEA